MILLCDGDSGNLTSNPHISEILDLEYQIRRMRMRSRESILVNNRKSLLHRGGSSVSTRIPHGQSPFNFERSFSYLFPSAVKATSQNLGSSLIITSAPLCLVILAKTWGWTLFAKDSCHAGCLQPCHCVTLISRIYVLPSGLFCLFSEAPLFNFLCSSSEKLGFKSVEIEKNTLHLQNFTEIFQAKKSQEFMYGRYAQVTANLNPSSRVKKKIILCRF